MTANKIATVFTPALVVMSTITTLMLITRIFYEYSLAYFSSALMLTAVPNSLVALHW